MDASELLRRITVPTPCPMDWNLMRGDDRMRFCDSCSKHVYNLSAMTASQIGELIRDQEGNSFCGRFYKRPDGSLVTSECPQTEPPRTRRRLQLRLSSIMSLVAMMATMLGFIKMVAKDEGSSAQQLSPPQPTPNRFSTPPPGQAFVGKVKRPQSYLPIQNACDGQ